MEEKRRKKEKKRDAKRHEKRGDDRRGGKKKRKERQQQTRKKTRDEKKKKQIQTLANGYNALILLPNKFLSACPSGEASRASSRGKIITRSFSLTVAVY